MRAARTIFLLIFLSVVFGKKDVAFKYERGNNSDTQSIASLSSRGQAPSSKIISLYLGQSMRPEIVL